MNVRATLACGAIGMAKAPVIGETARRNPGPGQHGRAAWLLGANKIQRLAAPFIDDLRAAPA